MNCNQCGKETKNPKFCSRSCAATCNNKKVVKRQLQGKCRNCLGPARSGRTYCNNCWQIPEIRGGYRKAPAEGRGFADVLCNMYRHHARIRNHARKKYFQHFPDHKCERCGYDLYIEIGHIKPVKSFNDAKHTYDYSIINSLDNIVGLCKNCHWELDRGFFNLSEIARFSIDINKKPTINNSSGS